MTAKDDANNTDEAPSHELNTENPPQLLFDGLPLPSGFRPYPGESLASVVKSIYAGLEMLEYRCAQPATSTDTELAAEDWQAFTALHYALLQHHLDFYVATQHSSAFPEFGGLAEKYWMPGRMFFFFFFIIYIALSIASINTMMLMQPVGLWSAAHALLIPLS
jgi:hypothetical protein